MLRPNMIDRGQKHLRVLAFAVLSVGASLSVAPSFAKDNGGADLAGDGAIDNDVYVVQRESVCMAGGRCDYVAQCPADSAAQGRLANGAPYCVTTGPARTLVP